MVLAMKKLLFYVLVLYLFLIPGCGENIVPYDIVATTLPVYEFTSCLCNGTDLSVGRLVTESVSCLHDYTLQVSQMRMIEDSEVIVISGAGLEDFLEDVLSSADHVVDASRQAHIHTGEHLDGHNHDHNHEHTNDPHIWLNTENAAIMANNICEGLSKRYPEYQDIFQLNLDTLINQIEALQLYGNKQLSNLSCRKLITFHDGFAYFAEGFDLEILEAIEEESGSEASAAEIIHLIRLIRHNKLPAVFTEISGSDACASILAMETGVKVFTLDMAMAGDSYFDSMYHNIDTIKEALE